MTAGILGVGASAYGITGLFGFLITTDYAWQYALEILVASLVAFAISWLLYKEEEVEEKHTEKEVVEDNKTDHLTIVSPVKGKAIPLAEVKDPTFAAEILGKGGAVVPAEGKIYAPCDGTVEAIFDTFHAIGLKSNEDVEILIHVGLDTVKLEGRHFTPYVKTGDKVEKGTLLLEFDQEAIKKEGYDITTPIIISNTMDYQSVEAVTGKDMNPGDMLISLTKGE
jgi:PTS system sucrose-specific IIC component